MLDQEGVRLLNRFGVDRVIVVEVGLELIQQHLELAAFYPRSYSAYELPSGVLRPSKLAVIGNGVMFDPKAFLDEVARLKGQGVAVSPDSSRLYIADHATGVQAYDVDETAAQVLRKAAPNDVLAFYQRFVAANPGSSFRSRQRM